MNEIIKLFISGDFAPTHRILELIHEEKYHLIYNDMLPVIQQADIAITNLEVPLIDNGKPIKKTGPNIKAPEKSIEALRYAGFSMVTLANNHIMDYGWEGLKSTIEICRNHDIDFIGVGENLTDAQTIKYVKVKDSIIAFINVAENEWSTTQGVEPGANPLDEVNQYYQISEARKSADFVILIVHGGHETYGLPSPRMKKLYRYFVDLGADAIVGHHTHCFSGHEIYKGKPIFYSLGNFLFDNPKHRSNSNWNQGCVVMLKIQHGKIDFDLIPYQQCVKAPGISLLQGSERSAFLDNAEEITALIQDDKELASSFDKFIQAQSHIYLSFLEPIKNKYLLAAMNRGIVPRLIKSAQKRLFLNLIRAEAHRDILINLLKKKVNDSHP